MLIQVVSVDKKITIDGEGFIFTKEMWDELKFPDFISIIEFNNITGIGAIEWSNNVMPPTPIVNGQFVNILQACFGIYNNRKLQIEQETMEKNRQQAEIQAKALVEAHKKELEAIELKARVVSIEEKLGIKFNENIDKEPL